MSYTKHRSRGLARALSAALLVALVGACAPHGTSPAEDSHLTAAASHSADADVLAPVELPEVVVTASRIETRATVVAKDDDAESGNVFGR